MLTYIDFTHIKRIQEEFIIEIKKVENSDLNDIKNAENGIRVSRQYLGKLRDVVRGNQFETQSLAIEFFKNVKPFVNSRLIFFLALYKYIIDKPTGTFKRQKNYIDNILESLSEKRKRYIDFERYYYQRDEALDKYYFVRGKETLSLISDVSHYFSDPEFSTSHDNLVAKIIADELFVNHLNSELNLLRKRELSISYDDTDHNLIQGLSWTASKTDLVELIYALQASGAVRNGQTEIKKIAMVCEKLFNIELGNFYRTYIEIRERKMDRTSFINRLKMSLEDKMKEDDDKY